MIGHIYSTEFSTHLCIRMVVHFVYLIIEVVDDQVCATVQRLGVKIFHNYNILDAPGITKLPLASACLIAQWS